MPPGRFVVFEGLDGSGTTTQMQQVTELLRAEGVAEHVYMTSEPTSRTLGAAARFHVIGETSLNERSIALAFSGDRLDHVAKDIRPQIERGAWVVCDRYYLSTLAYQGARLGAADAATPGDIDWQQVDEELEWLWQLNKHALRPDVTIFLEATRETRERRTQVKQWQADRYDERRLADVIEAVHDRAVAFLEARGMAIHRVDANRDVGRVAGDALQLILGQPAGPVA